jgi:hypothetical protein
MMGLRRALRRVVLLGLQELVQPGRVSMRREQVDVGDRTLAARGPGQQPGGTLEHDHPNVVLTRQAPDHRELVVRRDREPQ